MTWRLACSIIGMAKVNRLTLFAGMYSMN